MRTRTLLTVLAAALLTSACVDEKVVFQDRELFQDLPSSAADFVGYTDQDDKLVVCGNCHIEKQGDWEATGHADAWAGLQDSGHSQTFCEGCHTVNGLGNPADEGGYLATGDDRYLDVQCESCHGPGLAHVENPTDATIPDAALGVGTDATQGCGECHQGTHHPFTEQWEESGHAVVGFAASREGCRSCHSGNGALEAWGISTSYAEQGQDLSITCAVCHDPHAQDHSGQLRFPVGGVAVEDNLCSQCHNRRAVPDPNSSHGLHPHSPETGLLSGDIGWFPPGLLIDRGEIVASHGDEGNERLCAGCHVTQSTVSDAETGEFQFQAVGHGFNAIPCLDAQGIPTNQDCELSISDRDFEAGCTASGCHTSAQGAFSALSTATVRLAALAEELEELLAEVDPNGEGAGGEIDAADGRFTAAEGAFFNLEVAAFGGTDRPDPRLTFAAAASHNPFLTEQLLIASIQAVEDAYSVSASPGLALQRELVSGR